MDVLALLYDDLTRWLIGPATHQFLGIFGLTGRLGLVFILTSYGIAYGLFRFRKYRELTDAQSFWQFIGGNRVFLHRSALLDYRFYVRTSICPLGK
jgi:hypothetical protein